MSWILCFSTFPLICLWISHISPYDKDRKSKHPLWFVHNFSFVYLRKIKWRRELEEVCFRITERRESSSPSVWRWIPQFRDCLDWRRTTTKKRHEDKLKHWWKWQSRLFWVSLQQTHVWDVLSEGLKDVSGAGFSEFKQLHGSPSVVLKSTQCI